MDATDGMNVMDGRKREKRRRLIADLKAKVVKERGAKREATSPPSMDVSGRDGGSSSERKDVAEALLSELSEYNRRLYRAVADEISHEFIRWRDVTELPGEDAETTAEDRSMEWRLLHFFKGFIDQVLMDIFALRRMQAEFLRCYSGVTSEQEKRRLVLDFARDLGASPRQLRGDRKACARWFCMDSVMDRCERRRNQHERKLGFCLNRLGDIARRLILPEVQSAGTLHLWRRLGLETALKPFLTFDGDSRVRVEAFRCLAAALTSLSGLKRQTVVEQSTLQFIYRSALHPRQDVWIQIEALRLLASLSEKSFASVIRRRLCEPGGGDDIFVRRSAVQLLCKALDRTPSLRALVETALRDKSPFVRQGLAAGLAGVSVEVAGPCLLRQVIRDVAEPVRAQAHLSHLRLIERWGFFAEALKILRRGLEEETDPFVQQVAMKVAADGAEVLLRRRSPDAGEWVDCALESLEGIHTGSPDVALRRHAAQASERIWCAAAPHARFLRGILATYTSTLDSGERRRLPGTLVEVYSKETLGRVLSVLSQEGFGFDLSCRSNCELTRGQVFSFRLWRLLHELRHPSPDKRQAFPHTIGRRFGGQVRAPSGILCELAETKVPGEPLFIGEEGGWRPYLPLLDEVLCAVRPWRRAQTVRIFTSEGVTEVRPPGRPFRRWASYVRCVLGFPRYARLRNWREEGTEPADIYLSTLQKELGFTFKFKPYEERQPDPLVTRFFPAVLPFGGGDWWSQFKEYFLSTYENSMPELVVFIAFAMAGFVGRHYYSNLTMRRARESIPLVVGGWGTRGKSGTERLKAALFNALGHGMVSKTTGCEAMFLYAHPYGRTHELFLFRSYDKATIWEQRNIVRLAAKLKAEVFLWECMGLTPSYVEILQRSWMRDDIATVTNTYPDHEDLQGPAGYNIPEVMASFIPRRSKLLTSEDQMMPILREKAEKAGTEMTAVTWLDAGLITSDVLSRFPYDEHPNNIALVLALAGELGISRDFALKEMADRVVADLGVLKTYPAASIKRRRLEFTNGMSANERHGCLGNWRRLGFHKQDPEAEPGVWISTVVNNRADRIARSQVFAQILVQDIAADRHFLIGNNLAGLQGYIRQAWDEHSSSMSLANRAAGKTPADVLFDTARRLRLPTREKQVIERLEAMLRGAGVPSKVVQEALPVAGDSGRFAAFLMSSGLDKPLLDDIVRHHREAMNALAEFETLRGRLQSAGSGQNPDDGREKRGETGNDRAFREWARKWFFKKIVVVEDYSATGEQVIQRICEVTPPGFHNRIMGLQNIKGTGLDFVYRWQAWEACHRACVELRDKNQRTSEAGLRKLVSFQEYGRLCEEMVGQTIAAVRNSPLAQRESFQAGLGQIRTQLNAAMTRIRAADTGTSEPASRWTGLFATIEGLLDAGDAVRRRRTADRIYRDLASERISYARAAAELKKLIKKQKGGWLVDKLEALHGRLARQVSAWVTRWLKR